VGADWKNTEEIHKAHVPSGWHWLLDTLLLPKHCGASPSGKLTKGIQFSVRLDLEHWGLEVELSNH
jgi:hypothetical protein